MSLESSEYFVRTRIKINFVNKNIASPSSRERSRHLKIVKLFLKSCYYSRSSMNYRSCILDLGIQCLIKAKKWFEQNGA